MGKKSAKITAILLTFLLTLEQTAFAQEAGQLDLSGHLSAMHNILARGDFRPLHLRYLRFNREEDNFNLLLDKGNGSQTAPGLLEERGKILFKYFLIGLSLPNNKFWVNLRPGEPQNMIDDDLAKTDIGKILLAADLQLKKDTARLTSPQSPQGREYWTRLYQKAEELFGSRDITIPTLVRPWIVPGEIIVRESFDNIYIYKANLKIMLEEDYIRDSPAYNFRDERLRKLNEYSSVLIRRLILPDLTRELNSAERYAPLRQVYYSLILAQWFKSRYANQPGEFSKIIDSKVLSGLSSEEEWSTYTYFKEYEISFKEGEYNFKEPHYSQFGQVMRSYFSGGVAFEDLKGRQVAASGPIEFMPDYTVGMLCNGDPSDLHVAALDRFKGNASHFYEITQAAFSQKPLNTLSGDEINMLHSIVNEARAFRFQDIYLEDRGHSYSMGVSGQYFNHSADKLSLFISREFLSDFTLFARAIENKKITSDCIKGILTHEFGHLIPEFNLRTSPEKRELIANLVAFEPAQISSTMWYWLSRNPEYPRYSKDWLRNWALAYISGDPRNNAVSEEALQLVLDRIQAYEDVYRRDLLASFVERQKILNPGVVFNMPPPVPLPEKNDPPRAQVAPEPDSPQTIGKEPETPQMSGAEFENKLRGSIFEPDISEKLTYLLGLISRQTRLTFLERKDICEKLLKTISPDRRESRKALLSLAFIMINDSLRQGQKNFSVLQKKLQEIERKYGKAGAMIKGKAQKSLLDSSLAASLDIHALNNTICITMHLQLIISNLDKEEEKEDSSYFDSVNRISARLINQCGGLSLFDFFSSTEKARKFFELLAPALKIKLQKARQDPDFKEDASYLKFLSYVKAAEELRKEFFTEEVCDAFGEYVDSMGVVVTAIEDATDCLISTAQNRKASGPGGKTGGIDFRNLNAGGAQTEDAQWREFNILIKARIIPSIQRIKDYLEAGKSQAPDRKRIDNIRVCLIDILRLEEERADSDDSEFINLLSLIERGG